jgi:hypothetical protein
MLNPLRTRLNRFTVNVTKKQIAPTKRAVNDLRASIGSQQQAWVQLSCDLGEMRVDVKQALYGATVAKELNVAVRELATKVESCEKAVQRLDVRARELDDLIASHRTTLGLLFGSTGRFVTRLISEDDVNRLLDELSFVGDPETVAVVLHQAYRMLLELEIRGLGRLASSTPNALAKLAAVALLPAPSGEILEIGTLFGLGAVGLMRQLLRRDVDAFITIVDPFAGHQIQPDLGAELDVSGAPVSLRIVAANLSLGDVPASRYRLIEGLTGQPATDDLISDRKYGIIVIDGDHGRDAALADLLLAERVAEAGALVLLDDYQNEAWPGVERALDDYFRRDEKRLTLMGVAATTAVLRAD